MIHRDDHESLRRLLNGDVPDYVLAECELRTHLYHKDGTQGRLGSLALVEMLRFLGLGEMPAVVNEPLQTPDFYKMALDTTIWVKQESGLYRKAKYVGTHGHRPAVRYEGSTETFGVQPVRCLAKQPAADLLDQLYLGVDSPLPVVPPLVPDEWKDVQTGSPVLVEEGSSLREGVLVAVNGTMIRVKLDGEKKHKDFPAASCHPAAALTEK